MCPGKSVLLGSPLGVGWERGQKGDPAVAEKDAGGLLRGDDGGGVTQEVLLLGHLSGLPWGGPAGQRGGDLVPCCTPGACVCLSQWRD